MIVSLVIGSGSCARFHGIKDSIYSDRHVGFCEYRHKLLTICRVSAKALHVALQSGSIGFYAAGIRGKEPRLASLFQPVYKLLISHLIGILRGKMGIHDWDITFAQSESTNLQIVRK